jgi:6-phosphogluconolactonase
MKYTRIFTAVFFLFLLIFAGCEKNDVSTIDGPVNDNDLQSLSKLNGDTHAVFTLSNSSAGNEVIMFKRAGDGSLTSAGSFSTGGTGTDDGLGSQGALVLDGNLLFAVNAGSNEVSVLSVHGYGLTLIDKKASGGTHPISLTTNGRLLYVLNDGGTGNIAGFKINHDGTITQIAGSIQPLSSGASAPAQIEFSPNGRLLVVTEKATNMIDTYVVGFNGVASGPITQASAGDTPYGFVFDNRGRIIVSDAFGGGSLAGAMSSYNVSSNGISLISGPVYDNQTAPCWVAITKNGRFAYTTNTGTSNISGYKVKRNGSLELFSDSGNTASTGAGSKPIDMAVSNNSQFLYALSHGTNTISAFRIDNGHGRLRSVATVSGLTSATIGLAAN